MQAAGNDFVIIDARKEKYDWNKLARNMCDRHFGVGADGLITVGKDNNSNLFMRIFNADGSEAEACGNGMRCFAKFVTDYGIASGRILKIKTISGIKTATVFKSNGKVNRVRVNMGSPEFKAEKIPVSIKNVKKSFDIMLPIEHSLNLDGNNINLSFVSMGNPHAITFIHGPVANFKLTEIGPKIEKHAIFPQKTNFEVARVVNRKAIESRVWERGVGETLACGSGACAIAVTAIKKGLVDNMVDIKMPGGKLEISWDSEGDIFLTGQAEEVFKGEWLLN